MRAALRSRVAWVTALAAVITCATVALNRSAQWRGEWGRTLGMTESILVLLGPAVAAGCAFACAQFRGLNEALVLPTATRRTQAVLAPALAPAAVGLFVWLIVSTTMLVVTASYSPTDTVNVVAVCRALPLYCFNAVLGVALGTFLRPVPASLGAAAVSCGLLIAVTRDTHLSFLGPYAVTGSVAQWEPDTRVLSMHFGMLILVNLGLLWIVSGTKQRSRLLLVATGSVALLVVGGLSLTEAAQRTIWVPREPLQYSCEGDPIQVCFVLGNTRQTGQWAVAINRAARRLDGLGLSVPSRYQQFPPNGGSHSVGVLQVSTLNVNFDPPDPTDVVSSIAGPSDCGMLGNGAWQIVRSILAEWLMSQVEPGYRTGDPSLQAWMNMTTKEQQASWARRTQAQLQSCSAMPSLPFKLDMPNP